jgi:hypothetical protein
MIDPHSRTRFHPGLSLETWHPRGVLDSAIVAVIVSQVNFEERILDVPFNRFTDLSGVTAIRLDFWEVANIAAERRAAYAGRPPVKSAFLAISKEAYSVAQMFAALMEESPIDIEVFRTIEDAAQWLGVPVEALRAEP